MNPQFQKRAHRARTRLEQASGEYRWMFRACEVARQEGIDWPEYIFTPLDRALAELPDVLLEMGGQQAVDEFKLYSMDETVLVVSAGLTWASWRMTQGIYRFDPALYPHLTATAGGDSIPAEILTHLPEWCVYIETPGIVIPSLKSGGKDADLHGAWVRLDIGDHGIPILVVTADTDAADPTIPPTQIVYLDGSIESGIMSSITRLNEISQPWPHDPAQATKKIRAWIEPVINLALYLCTDAEYSRRGTLDTPGNPIPKKTRRDGWRLFPAAGPVEWDVGVRIGSALREAYQREQTGGDAAPDGKQVRPHVRRAHWHGFRSGPKKDAEGHEIPTERRKFDVRWMPPIPVNVESIESLPAVVRKVK